MNDAVEQYIGKTLDDHERRLSALEKPYKPPVKGDVAENWIFNGQAWVMRYPTFNGLPTYKSWLHAEKSARTERAEELYRVENRIAWDKLQAELKKIEDFK